MEVDCCSDSLMVVRLCGTPVDLVVMVVYMPTSDNLDEEVEKMYDKVEEKMTCKGKDYVVVLGDINATLGDEKILNMVGNSGLRKRNIRVEMLVDFCVRNNLTITNTLFKNNNRRRYTSKAPEGIRKLWLDYVIVRQRYKTSKKNSCFYPAADVDSDHKMVIMKVNLKLKKEPKQN
ncbi:craniofacial development protein 2-like [Penaeus monodon]|uniref:craniofacial development protein 2-like n=1 Tax=Penaeus monodon TaxID=6687 RepID=UPI0018A72229|nr:craniofacial development protein 2-like [Penaeus monodon]